MHIVTGLAVTALLRLRQKKGPLLEKIFSYGPIRTVSAQPGRTRFRVRSLIGDGSAGQLLTDRLARIEGVESIEVTPRTGSVLIRYRPDADVNAALLGAAIVRLLGLDSELRNQPQTIVGREASQIIESLNRAVHDQTGGLIDLKWAIIVTLAVAGTYQVLAAPRRALPPGMTLLWWAMVSMGLGRSE